MRQPDETIPLEEKLYRGLDPTFVDGERINEKAIDLEGTSVQRSSYAAPQSVLTVMRTGVGEVQVGEIPPANVLPNGVEWEWFAVDDPSEEQGEGHAELRARRTADRPSKEANKPNSKAAKQELRILLAGKMHILIRPTPHGEGSPHAADRANST